MSNKSDRYLNCVFTEDDIYQARAYINSLYKNDFLTYGIDFELIFKPANGSLDLKVFYK